MNPYPDGASNAEIVVVGDFDPADIQKVAAALLAGWRSAAAYTRIARYSVNSILSADAKDPRADWMMFAIANPINVAKLQAAFQGEMEKALKEGFTSDELAAAKKGWLQSRNVQRSQDVALPPVFCPTSANPAPWPSTWNWRKRSPP